MSERKKYPSQKYLKECFNYDGISLLWKKRPLYHFSDIASQKTFNTRFADKEAGVLHRSKKGNNYRLVCVDGPKYAAHIIIWIILYGEFEGTIDHIDGDSANNCLDNLRAVSFRENHKNRKLPKSNKSGCMGIYFNKKYSKWIASIKADGQAVYLGSFCTKFDAACARRSAEKKYGFHENHGQR